MEEANMIQNIPLIVPSFNQLTYLKNIINWWKWYSPQSKIYIVDNASESSDINYFYEQIPDDELLSNVGVYQFSKNDCVGNLRTAIDEIVKSEYYVISDPDIMPLPGTPPNFLEIFKHAIDHYGYHHAGFGLKTDDIPAWFEGRANMLHDEMALLNTPVEIGYNGKLYHGYKAPIDTTFALYKKSNGGWSNPQSPESWSNSLRMFSAYHLPWYLHPDHLNEEMQSYFSSAEYRIPGKTSTGKNNYRPKKYQSE